MDLTWNSSRLEGNTYSLLETERLLQTGKAIAFLLDTAKEIGIQRYTLYNLPALLSDNLFSDPIASGRLRAIPVGIARSGYLPCGIPQIIEECFSVLLQKAQAIQDPMEQAFFLLVQIPYLQPFEDVNKRTSRLAANIPLLQHPLSFVDVSEPMYIQGLLGIYEYKQIELLSDLFLWAYERSCALYKIARKSLREPDPFRFHYRAAIFSIVQQIVKELSKKLPAVSKIQPYASIHIPKQARAKFQEWVERELLSLHEGNIARYNISLKEYLSWKEIWDKS